MVQPDFSSQNYIFNLHVYFLNLHNKFLLNKIMSLDSR